LKSHNGILTCLIGLSILAGCATTNDSRLSSYKSAFSAKLTSANSALDVLNAYSFVHKKPVKETKDYYYLEVSSIDKEKVTNSFVKVCRKLDRSKLINHSLILPKINLNSDNDIQKLINSGYTKPEEIVSIPTPLKGGWIFASETKGSISSRSLFDDFETQFPKEPNTNLNFFANSRAYGAVFCQGRSEQFASVIVAKWDNTTEKHISTLIVVQKDELFNTKALLAYSDALRVSKKAGRYNANKVYRYASKDVEKITTISNVSLYMANGYSKDKLSISIELNNPSNKPVEYKVKNILSTLQYADKSYALVFKERYDGSWAKVRGGSGCAYLNSTKSVLINPVGSCKLTFADISVPGANFKAKQDDGMFNRSDLKLNVLGTPLKLSRITLKDSLLNIYGKRITKILSSNE